MATQVVRSTAGEGIQSAVGMLKLLADETRLRVICALLEGEHPVNELAELGAPSRRPSPAPGQAPAGPSGPQPAGGTRIYYVLDDAHVRRLVEEVLFHAGHVTSHD